jgi:hypothetical protein
MYLISFTRMHHDNAESMITLLRKASKRPLFRKEALAPLILGMFAFILLVLTA